ncbi:MAG: 50S ribosomal protein L18 [Candidatus Gracilibacteria bacterium]
MLQKLQKRLMRKARVRAKIHGTATRPRLAVFRSNVSIFAQLINDDLGVTLASASSKSETGSKTECAHAVGIALGKIATEKGIRECVFDRAGFQYHGRVKALADAARSTGLNF